MYTHFLIAKAEPVDMYEITVKVEMAEMATLFYHKGTYVHVWVSAYTP